MNRTSTCQDCGESFGVASAVGPLPRRCSTCAPAYQREAQVEREQRRRDRRAGGELREVVCVDCGTKLDWSGQGRPKLRCPDCLKAHARESARCRYASEVATAPEVARERWRQGYRRNAERIRAEKLDQHYRKRYGLTRDEVEALREARSGLCEICGRPPRGKAPGKVSPDGGPTAARLHVDHCHGSGRVRGLLCGNCNTMIGLAGEDPKVLMAAVEYLERG